MASAIFPLTTAATVVRLGLTELGLLSSCPAETVLLWLVCLVERRVNCAVVVVRGVAFLELPELGTIDDGFLLVGWLAGIPVPLQLASKKTQEKYLYTNGFHNKQNMCQTYYIQKPMYENLAFV